jgi:hypothetical protein
VRRVRAARRMQQLHSATRRSRAESTGGQTILPHAAPSKARAIARRAMISGRRVLAALIGLAIGGCAAPPGAPPHEKQDQVVVHLLRLLPPTLADRAGWAADIYAAFATQGLTPSTGNLCAVLAITEQESGFRADPAVPGLGEIAWREIDQRAERAGVSKFAVRAALQLASSDGRSYSDRIDAARTERELSEIYEDMIARVPMGPLLFARHNPVKTGGPMQVSIAFAESYAAARPYPYPSSGSIRREVFTRRGGMYFGIAHLLGYDAPYADPVFRFADFNAGRYASRNAAFQRAVSTLSKTRLDLDGDLLAPGSEPGTPGETERATITLSPRLGISASAIRRDLELGDRAEFGRTTLYERVFDLADRTGADRAPRGVIPNITLKSPKISRKLTTEWFARRVEERYRRCLSKAPETAAAG